MRFTEKIVTVKIVTAALTKGKTRPENRGKFRDSWMMSEGEASVRPSVFPYFPDSSGIGQLALTPMLGPWDIKLGEAPKTQNLGLTSPAKWGAGVSTSAQGQVWGFCHHIPPLFFTSRESHSF